MIGPSDLPELREFIRSRRAALFGFMEQGAALELDGDVLRVIPRNDIYVRYLNDNCAVIAELATEFYRRPIEVQCGGANAAAANGSNPAILDEVQTAQGNGHANADRPKASLNGSRLPHAIAYVRRGFRIFPAHEIEADNECSCGKLGCSSAGKHPRFSGWQESATTDEVQIRQWWQQYPTANIGVKCGADSNLTVLDVDGDVGRETLRALELERGELPETPVAITGSGGAHYYFAFEDGMQNAVRFAPGLDIRTEGGLVVGVGSQTTHRYEWEAAFTLSDELKPARMPAWLVDLVRVAATKGKSNGAFHVAREIPAGERNDTLYRVGRSLRAKGLGEPAIQAALREENIAKCRPPLSRDEVDLIAHRCFAAPDRADFEVNSQQKREAPSDPISLDVPMLPLLVSGIFPTWAESFIDAVAAATETPRELAAMMELGTIATALQRKFVVQVQPGYVEPLNLWALPALPSGHRKTQVQHAHTRPLRRWEAEHLSELAPRVAEAESQRETALARIAALRAKAARTDDSADYAQVQQQIEGLESKLPDVPKLPKLWCQDVTPEKLGVLMAENNEAMSLISDEGGISDILAGRYSHGVPNLDLFLQAHAGTPVRVDRGSRSSVVLDSPALTLILSPQPNILEGLAAKPGFRGRGLLARFLYMLPVSNIGYRTGNTQPVPEAVSGDRDAHIRALLGFKRPETGPHIITLSDEAYAAWREFAAQIEVSMREGGRLEQLQDWGGKLPGAAIRIAGNLHVAGLAFGAPADSRLNIDTMQRALQFAEVLVAHAVAAFDLMGADEALKDARKVWKWIARERNPQFTFRELFNALRGTFPRTEALERPVEVLIERHHIAPVESPPRAGRPTRVFEVNPKLSEGWKS